MHFIVSLGALCLGAIVAEGATLHQKRFDISITCHNRKGESVKFVAEDVSEEGNVCNDKNQAPHCDCTKMKSCGTAGLLCYPFQQCATCDDAIGPASYHCGDSNVPDMDFCANKEGGLAKCTCGAGGSAALIPGQSNLEALLPAPETQERKEPSSEPTFSELVEPSSEPEQAPEEISQTSDEPSETGSISTYSDTTSEDPY